MFERISNRISEVRKTRANNSLEVRQKEAGEVVQNLLRTIGEIFPEQVDPSILDTNVQDLGSEELIRIQRACGFIATDRVQQKPLLELVEARETAEHFGILQQTPGQSAS